jgi:hypothetical protein
MPPKKRAVTEAEHAQIVAMGARGMCAAQIAREIGRAATTVFTYARVHRIALERGGRISGDKVARLHEMIALGFGPAACASAFGCSRSAVWALARREGITFTPPTRSRRAIIAFDEPEYLVLHREATRRAMSVPQFCRVLAAAVMSGGLVNAVLDVGELP